MSDYDSPPPSWYEPPDDDGPERIDCWDCGGEGVTHHDCGEDTCHCLNPEDNVTCETCGGRGTLDPPEPDPDRKHDAIKNGDLP